MSKPNLSPLYGRAARDILFGMVSRILGGYMCHAPTSQTDYSTIYTTLLRMSVYIRQADDRPADIYRTMHEYSGAEIVGMYVRL